MFWEYVIWMGSAIILAGMIGGTGYWVINRIITGV